MITIIVIAIVWYLLNKPSESPTTSNNDASEKEIPPNARVVNKLKLKQTLIEVKEYLKKSEESIWAPDTPQDIIMFFDKTIKLIDEDKTIDINELEMLFGPTSSIQDLSIDNGWGEQYLDLSTAFDSNIGKI